MGSETMAAFGIATKDLNCGMETNVKEPSSKSGKRLDPIECCQNQFELVQNDIQQNFKSFSNNSVQLVFIAAFTHSFIFSLAREDSFDHPPACLAPPSIEKDITILFQSFLI